MAEQTCKHCGRRIELAPSGLWMHKEPFDHWFLHCKLGVGGEPVAEPAAESEAAPAQVAECSHDKRKFLEGQGYVSLCPKCGLFFEPSEPTSSSAPQIPADEELKLSVHGELLAAATQFFVTGGRPYRYNKQDQRDLMSCLQAVRQRMECAEAALAAEEMHQCGHCRHPKKSAYRCYDCKAWICEDCAPAHFPTKAGKHIEEERNASRIKINELRAALAAERERTREEAAKVADVWAKSPSCDHHDSNPCCHVRTGAGIAAAIRALSRTEPEAQS